MRMSKLCIILTALFLVSCKGQDEKDPGEAKALKTQEYYNSVVVDPFTVQPLALFSGERLEEVLTNALYIDSEVTEAPVDLFTTPSNVSIHASAMPQAADDGQNLFVISRKGSKYWPTAPWGFDVLPLEQSGGDNNSAISVDLDTDAYDVPEEFRWKGGWTLDVNKPYMFELPDWRPGLFMVEKDGVAKKVAVLDYIPEKNIRVQVYDVADTANAQLNWTLRIDGMWKGAEQVGNVLYIWSQYTVDNVARLRAQPMTGSYENLPAALAALQKRNEDLDATPKDESSVLPSYTRDGETQLLTNDCLLPSDTEEATAYTHLINVTAINLLDGSLQSSCLGGESNSFSVSADSVYVANSYSGTEGYQTVIHKFNHTNDGLSYAATGDVAGILNKESQIFSTENDLRLATSFGSGHQLYVLEQDAGLLKVVSSPLSEELDLIGEISAQFFGDAVFLTGGINGDELSPVYVVDLSDTSQPILSQTIDTSDHLDIFPLNNQYAFSWGFFIGDEELGINYGVSASLLTVSGEFAGAKNTIRAGDGEPGGRFHVGIFPVSDDETRITFPVMLKSEQDEWIDGIKMIEVTGMTTDTAKMEEVGVLALESLQGSSYGIQVRVVGNEVTIANSGALWSADWGKPDSISEQL